MRVMTISPTSGMRGFEAASVPRLRLPINHGGNPVLWDGSFRMWRSRLLDEDENQGPELPVPRPVRNPGTAWAAESSEGSG